MIGDIAEVSPGKIPPPRVLDPQIDSDHYLGNESFQVQLEYPRSFILQETVGDLVFKLITKEPVNRTDIYIPPEFKVNLDKSYLWSSINNSYGKIGISKVSSEDKIAPNWYDVSLTNSGNETRPATRPSSSGHDTKGTIWRGNYTVRLFNVTAPSVVGRYFFKVFTNGTSIGVKNFPSVIVSADPNPAYISGCVKYGGHVDAFLSFRPYVDPIGSSDSAGAPIGLLKGKEGGKVYATGITPDGRIVVGQAFFNSTSSNYTLYGLAPGRYRLNATAAGFAPAELSYEIALKAGQSLHGVDIFLEHSPSLRVVALSRWMGLREPWGSVAKSKPRNITFEILDYANLTVTLRDKTTVPEEDRCVFYYNGSRDLDGHIPQEYAGYVAGIAPGTYYVRAWVNGYIQPSASNERALTRDCMVVFSQNNQSRQIELPLEKTGIMNVTIHFRDSYQVQQSPVPFSGKLTVEAYDIDDMLRASNSTFVEAGKDSASVELTGLLNTTRDYGLPQGTYTISASFQGYIQPIERGRVRAEHKVTIGDGRSETSFYMLLLGRLNLNIFSINWQRPFSSVNWAYPGSSITFEIRNVYSLEVYKVYSTVKITQPENAPSVNGLTVTGLDDGTYSVHVFTYGYIQEKSSFFSVRKGEIADISVFMTKGVEIGITLVFQKQRILDSIDTYKIDWRFNWSRVPVRFEIYDSKAQFVGADTAYVNSSAKVFSSTIAGFKSYYGNPAARWANYYDTTDGVAQKDYGLKPDLYTIEVYVLGYHQQSDPTIDLRNARYVSVAIVLQRMGHVSGMVHAFNTMYEKYTRISWVSVDALGEYTTLRTCSLDGFYELWVNPGSYLMIFSLPGYQTKSLRMHVTEGSDIPRNLELLPFEMSIRSHFQFLVPRSVWSQTWFDLNILQMTPPKSKLMEE